MNHSLVSSLSLTHPTTEESSESHNHSARRLAQMGIDTTEHVDDCILSSEEWLVSKLKGILMWPDNRVEMVKDIPQCQHSMSLQTLMAEWPVSCGPKSRRTRGRTELNEKGVVYLDW